MIQTDYLIIGSGVAGLTFAIKIATKFPNKKITIVTKSSEDESNTKYAQGGIAIVQNKLDDNFEKHIDDTIVCGDGLCDKDIVSMVITDGPKRLKELIDWGTRFDQNEEGTLDLGREGGHSKNRIVHHKDQTGYEIERAILKQVHTKNNIEIFDFHFALELITENNYCYGAYVLNERTNKISIFQAEFTLLATGGIGQVYGHTTNSSIATGDGIAMANRINATIEEMEFIQFHPTALYNKTFSSTFLISEAVRGFGGYLRTKNGDRFMMKYDKRGDLASRDIVSQSIEKELKKSGDECVYLDCTHFNILSFTQHFPLIYSSCKAFGIDIEKQWIPVLPAQHYLCGGISVNTDGQTSVNNLFACGECSRTGLHGANRLASNSLLEALVFSNRIYNYLASLPLLERTKSKVFPKWKDCNSENVDQTIVIKMKTQLQILMQKKIGIVRNDSDLIEAKKQIESWNAECISIQKKYRVTKEFYELRNMIEVALLIVRGSIERNENRGGFMKVNTLKTTNSD